jgi:hypothetical protein
LQVIFSVRGLGLQFRQGSLRRRPLLLRVHDLGIGERQLGVPARDLGGGAGQTRLPARNLGGGGRDRPPLGLDLLPGEHEVGPGAGQPSLVRAAVDGEEQIALLHRLVVHHVQLDDGTAHLRRDADNVGADRGVIGARIHEVQPICVDARDDSAHDDQGADGSAEDPAGGQGTLGVVHASAPVQREPSEHGQERREARVD